MVLIVCCTAYCAPCPMAIMMTTAPTPITMPSMVKRRAQAVGAHGQPGFAEHGFQHDETTRRRRPGKMARIEITNRP